MKKILTDNLGLKALALLFSIALWFIVVNINDPVDRTIFRAIPVEILNGDVVSSQGKVYEILDNTDTIDVTVWANRSILDSLRRDNIIATADMEEVNLNDTMVRIKLYSNRYNDRIESMIPSEDNLSIRIEDLHTKQLYINAATLGTPANGYTLGTVKTEQNLIRLSGPKSVIDTVSRAEASVDISGLTRDIRTFAKINLYDSNGNIINNTNVKRNIDGVGLDVAILKVARIPVNVRIDGTPGEGYALTGEVDISPATISVVGSESVLNTISAVVIPSSDIDVSGETGTVVSTVDITKYLPQGVTPSGQDDTKVTVTVYMERLTTAELSIDRETIQFANMPHGLRGEVGPGDEYIRVRVRGLAAGLSVLPNALVPAGINVGEFMMENGIVNLEPGHYEMPVTLTLPDGIKQESPITVPVIITSSTP